MASKREFLLLMSLGAMILNTVYLSHHIFYYLAAKELQCSPPDRPKKNASINYELSKY